MNHRIDLSLRVASHSLNRIDLLFSLMTKNSHFLSIVFQTFLALVTVTCLSYALQNFFQVVFNIVLNDVDLDDVLSQTVILYVSYLRIFILFGYQVSQMISFHLLNNLNQPIVKGCCQIDLLLIGLFQTAELLNVHVVLLNHIIAQFENLSNLLIDWLILVLW